VKRWLAVCFSILAVNACGVAEVDEPVNFLLITADDLEWSSVGVYGSKVEDITPNIDQLAAEGLRFTNAHVNLAI